MAVKKTETNTTIQSVISNLKKKYPQNKSTAKTPTGILPVDFVLRGGYISPSFTEIAGESGTGKTTLALSVSKSLIKRGHRVLYLNFEQAIIQSLVEDMGMDKLPEDKFLLLAPASIGESEDIIREICYATDYEDEPYYDHIVFDSIGGMTPDYLATAPDKGAKAIDSTDATPAVRARQLGKFFEIHTARLKRRGISCWFINHLSKKIDTSFGAQYRQAKNEKNTKGGVAVKYWCDYWLWIETGETLTKASQDNVTGSKKSTNDSYANIATIQNTKGRSGGMLKKTDFPVFFGRGVSNTYWIYLVLKNAGYATTSGGFTKLTILPSAPSLQGINKICAYIAENQKEIVSAMKKKGLWNFFEDPDADTKEDSDNNE